MQHANATAMTHAAKPTFSFHRRKRLARIARWKIGFILMAFGILLACAPSAKKQDQQVKAYLAESANYYTAKGTAELEKGHYDQAIQNFREAILLTAYDPVLHNNLGVAFFHLGKMDSAIAAYQTALLLRPHYGVACRNLAAAYYAAKWYPLALQAVDQALQVEMRDIESLSLKASILEAMNQLDDAITVLSRAVAMAPDSALLINHYGALLFQKGKIDQAIEQFQMALGKAPQFAAASFNLANALARQCRLQESRVHYENAVANAPFMIGAHNNLGLVLIALGKGQEAIACFRRALSLQAEADVVLYNLSLALARMDSAAAALPFIDEAIRIAPQRANYYRQRGTLLTRLDRRQEARLAFQRAVALDSTLASGFNDLGIAFFTDHEPDEALKAYQKAVELYPDFLESRYFRLRPDQDQHYIELLAGCDNAWEISADYATLYINLGKAYAAVGKTSEAEKAFEKAISLQPHLPGAYEELALLYQQQKKIRQSRLMASAGRVQRGRYAVQVDSLDAAERYVQQALRLHPHQAEAYAVLAEVRLKQQRWADVEDLLHKGLSLDTKSVSLYILAGRYALRQQQPNRALSDFQQALRFDPESIAACFGMVEALDSLGRQAEGFPYKAQIHYLSGQELEFAGQWDRSLLEYQQAARLMSTNSRYLASQGLVLAKKHFNDEAEEKFSAALRLDSLDTMALYGLGLIYGDRGEYAAAILFLRKAIQQDSLFSRAHYSLAINYFFNRQPEPARRHLLRAQALGMVVRQEVLDALQIP